MNKTKKYLFVCNFGESRSKYFSESFMEKGCRSLFCGIDKESMIKINPKLVNWADIVILLSQEVLKLEDWIEDYCKEREIKLIKNYVIDDPKYFFEELHLLMGRLDKEEI